MVRPPALKKGDKVGIVATGKQISAHDIESAEQILTSWGLSVQIASHLFSDYHQYLAGTDDERSGDFQFLVDKEEIKAIICARGGYGTTRIIDRFDLSTFQENPKWIVGFSDVTSLHLKLLKTGVESIHGIMPVLFSKPEHSESLESLRKVLFGIDVPIHSKPNSFNKPGKSTGQVVGGNLSLLVDSLATSTEPDLSEKILVIEEVDEYFYKVDRMLTQLKRSGKLSKLAGLVVGHMSGLKETSPGFGEIVEEILVDKLVEYSYPVAFNFPIGHDSPNLAWRHGSTMTLEVSATESSLNSLQKIS